MTTMTGSMTAGRQAGVGAVAKSSHPDPQVESREKETGPIMGL